MANKEKREPLQWIECASQERHPLVPVLSLGLPRTSPCLPPPKLCNSKDSNYLSALTTPASVLGDVCVCRERYTCMSTEVHTYTYTDMHMCVRTHQNTCTQMHIYVNTLYTHMCTHFPYSSAQLYIIIGGGSIICCTEMLSHLPGAAGLRSLVWWAF